VPDHAQIVRFFAGHDVETSVVVQIEQTQQLPFDTRCSPPMSWKPRSAPPDANLGRAPEDTDSSCCVFTTHGAIDAATRIDIRNRNGLPGPDSGWHRNVPQRSFPSHTTRAFER
jgi:hypothetical protein